MKINLQNHPIAQQITTYASLSQNEDLSLHGAKARSILRSAKNSKKTKTYHWAATQQRKYIDFLVEYRSLFELDSDKRRVLGIHVRMSRLIKNRTPTQCRSHHQKMLMKHGSIENVIFQNKHLLSRRNLEKNQCSAEKTLSADSQEKRQFFEVEDFFTLESFAKNLDQQKLFESELKEVDSQQWMLPPLYDIY